MSIKAKIDSQGFLQLWRKDQFVHVHCPINHDLLDGHGWETPCHHFCALFGEPEQQENGSNILTICDDKWFEIVKDER
jgi:hypothetical protein